MCVRVWPVDYCYYVVLLNFNQFPLHHLLVYDDYQLILSEWYLNSLVLSDICCIWMLLLFLCIEDVQASIFSALCCGNYYSYICYIFTSMLEVNLNIFLTFYFLQFERERGAIFGSYLKSLMVILPACLASIQELGLITTRYNCLSCLNEFNLLILTRFYFVLDWTNLFAYSSGMCALHVFVPRIMTSLGNIFW